MKHDDKNNQPDENRSYDKNPESIWDKTGELGSTAWNTTKEGVVHAGEAVAETSSDVWNAAKNMSDKVRDETKEAGDEVWKATKSGASKLKSAIFK